MEANMPPRPILIVTLLMLAAGLAGAQSLQECYNGVGVFSSETPAMEAWWEEACNNALPLGAFDLHVVLFNPWNEGEEVVPTGIGGFELRVEWPEAWFVTPHLPGANAGTAPDFVVSGVNLPVANNQSVLMRLQCGIFLHDPSDAIFVRAVSAGGSVPGEIVIRDAADESPSLGTNLYFDFDAPMIRHCSPVLGGSAPVDWTGDCWQVRVPSTGHTWGAVKALYR
jgi:hypothetical protein